MIITYQEENYFKVQSGEQTILTDPTNQRSIKGANVVIFSSIKDSEIISQIPLEEGSPISIYHQGEYEIGGIHIRGWSTEHEGDVEKTMYNIQWDDISIGILGPLTKELDAKTLFAFQEIDILIVPAGGKPYIQQSAAAKIIRQLKPGIIIPSLFKDLKPFLREIDGDDALFEEKLTIKKKDIVPNAMKIVVLKPCLPSEK